MSVRLSVRSGFTPFQLEYLHETFRIYIWYGQDYAHEIFSRQGAPFFFDAPKRGFSVKRIEVLQFLSQNVQIFRMCSSNHGQKNVGNRFLIQGPQIFSGGVKNGQNFELFYYLTQKLEILVVQRLWGTDYISIEKFWFGAPVWPPGALKGQNFEIFVFQRRSFKILLYTDFAALISYQLKYLGLGPRFGPPGAPKGQNFKIFVSQRRTFKILLYSYFVALISYQLKNLGLRPRFGPSPPLPAPKVKILEFLFFNVGPSKFGCTQILMS